VDGLEEKKFQPLQNALLDINRVFNSKCPKHSAKKVDKNQRVVLPM
jgi:hypothetical protein